MRSLYVYVYVWLSSKEERGRTSRRASWWTSSTGTPDQERDVPVSEIEVRMIEGRRKDVEGYKVMDILGKHHREGM